MSYNKDLITHKLIRWENYMTHYKLPAWKELPDIGLYMDQVIALLGQYLDFIPVEDQKNRPVTPTTINNYVRLKVMPAPRKRKYYRIHIAYLIMIFTMKQGISLGGIQQFLPDGENEDEVRSFYTSYVERLRKVAGVFTQQTRETAKGLLEPEGVAEITVEDVILQAILSAGFSRIMAEKLLNLYGADPEQVMEQERINDETGVHPLYRVEPKEE